MDATALRETLIGRGIKFSHLATALKVESKLVTEWCQGEKEIPPYIEQFLAEFKYDPIDYIKFTDKWPEIKVKQLMSLHNSGAKPSVIAKQMNVTVDAVEAKIKQLHLARNGAIGFRKEEELFEDVIKHNVVTKLPPTTVRKYDPSESWRCLGDNCRNTRQPGQKFCASHLVPHKNRRAHMVDSIVQVSGKDW